jgi:hypothetical protein
MISRPRIHTAVFGLASSLFMTNLPVQAQSADTKVFASAFSSSRSSLAEFSKGRSPSSFYVALRVEALPSALTPNKCVDDSFLAWVRKFFRQDNARIALVAKVAGPGVVAESAQPIPLFEISKNEAASSLKCLYSIQPDTAITGYYLANPNSPFQIEVQILMGKDARVIGAETLVNVSKELLGFAQGSANASLTQLVASPLLAKVANKVDVSLAANWSMSQQESYRYDFSPWPINGDWAGFRDQRDFAVGRLLADAGGVRVDPTLIPSVRILPQYRVSLFGNGPGAYVSADRILVEKLVPTDRGELESVLRDGIAGFSIDQVMAITDLDGMRTFCSKMRPVLARFLTDDDALAARYAILKARTMFFRIDRLRDASECMYDAERQKLPTLNADFVADDNRRQITLDRRRFVDARIRQVAIGLAKPTAASLSQIVLDGKNFRIDLNTQSAGVFPSPFPDGRVTADGQVALDALLASGGFRVACANAIPTQSIGNLVAMVQGKSTGKTSAMFIQFSNADPVKDDDPSKERVAVKRLSFMPPEVIAPLLGVEGWPEVDCPFTS